MLTYKLVTSEFLIPPRCVLLDTNILVARFLRSDKYHQYMDQLFQFLEYEGYVPLIPISVCVEAWGLLNSRQRDTSAALSLFLWLCNPANVVLIGDDVDDIEEARMLSEKLKVDMIDSLLFLMAPKLFHQCNLTSPLPIVTFDQKDYYQCFGFKRVAMSILSPETLEFTDLS
jgi:predicted nucleic acid-binding protein